MTDRYRLLGRHREHDPVLLSHDGIVDRARLADAVGRAATRLRTVAGARVLLVGDDRAAVLPALLAAWSAGLEVVVPPNNRAEAVSALASWIDCAIVDAGELVADGGASAPVDEVVVAADQPLVQVVTSGSTGEPSVHRKAASELLGEAMMLAETLGIGRGSTVVATVPPHHIYGLLLSVAVPVLVGAGTWSGAPLHGNDVRRACDTVPGCVLVTVPFHLRQLLSLPAGALASIRSVISSTAPLDLRLAADVVDRHDVDLIEIFGSTETGGVATRRPPGETAWKPLPGVEVAVDGHGRLVVASPFAGSAAFTTADVCEPVGDGFVHLGRSDGVVKIGGKRISTAALERGLVALDGVNDAVVVALPDAGDRGRRLVALVAADDRWTPAGLRDELARHWDHVVLPREIRIVERLARSNHGKIDRQALEALLAREAVGR